MAGRIQGSLVGMLIVACIGFCACLQAQEVHVSSRITQVTLFQQQAEVTRLAKAQIGAGRSSVIFDDVPQSLNADSLKVNGSGSAAVAIEGVEYKTVYLSAEFSKEAQVLDDKIGVLNAEALLVSRSKERIESQRKSLQSLELDRNVPDGGDKAVRPRSAKEMAEVLSFVSDSSSRLDTELRAVEERAESLAKQLTALQQERSKYQPSRKSKSVVEVKLSSARETEVSLEVTYQTGSAGWSSTYNLMVSEAQADLELELQTYALISQRSGEDWLDVALTLSTARPQLGLNRPVPQPKVLDVYEPPPPVQALSRSLKANAAGARQQSFGMEEGVMMDMAAAPAPQLAMVETSSSVESSPGGVVSYKLPARISLRSDGSSEKVKVSSVSLTGSMLYVAVPSMTPHVFREATLRNSSDAPLLPGTISVFSEGSFVGRQAIGFVPREKELKLPVGISEEVQVTRKLVRRFEEDPGIVRSFRRISTEYAIELENLSAGKKKVVLLEPEVLSRNEKIKVSVTRSEPAGVPADKPERLFREPGLLEWQLDLPAKGKLTVSSATSVEFPADLRVTGLDSL